MLYTRVRRKLIIMALEEESNQQCEGFDQQLIGEEHSDGESIMERRQLQQESRTDIDRVVPAEIHVEGTSGEEREEVAPWQNEDAATDSNSQRICSVSNEETLEPIECASGSGQCSTSNNMNQNTSENFIFQGNQSDDDESVNAARLERYGNYLERYGPQLERYGNQLERFGSQLERIGPKLERCGNSLERYGPHLEAIGRELVRSSNSQAESESNDERPGCQPQGNMSLQTQTESGSEGFAPLSADSCQGSSTSNSPRQGQWVSSPNPRRLSRRPSFQVNDGLVRHWIRRRNLDSRDIMPFNRFREERRRSLWRNDGDLRDFRRVRASWRYQDNLFNRQHNITNGREHVDNEDQGRSGRAPLPPPNGQNENGGLLQQDNVRLQRNEGLHQDDPDYGFVLVDEHNSPGPSRPDTSSQPTRRPRSHMSLRPLNIFTPPILGSIAEYNAESDEENNDQRQNVFGRRALRGREGSVIRSWVMMNNYFQTRPLFIGQGDSKAIDGPFTLQRVQHEDHLYNGNDRNVDLARVVRPIARNQRAERPDQRHQIAFQALA